MRITKHGRTRVYGRTMMTPEEVLFLISNEFTVRLRTDRDNAGPQYHLFYSPPDADTRIAVVSGDGTTLITIWEKDYVLPRGVELVTPDLECDAESTLLEKIEQTERRRLRGQIDVRVGPGSVYTHDCGEILFKGERTIESVSTVMLPRLSRIATLVEENRETSGERITYLIRLSDPHTLYPMKPLVMVKHSDLVEQMLPTA